MGQGKPVVTLDPAALEQTLMTLWTQYCSSKGKPDAIIGIAYGGSVCAGVLARLLDIPVFTVSLRRPGTARKQKLGAKWVLPLLPYPVTDQLRRWEDRRRKADPVPPTDDALPEHLVSDVANIAQRVQAQSFTRLMILDDALDSGVTLWSVKKALHLALGDTMALGSAVIVQTGDRVAAQADVTLYRNILCRFPWSYDYR